MVPEREIMNRVLGGEIGKLHLFILLTIRAHSGAIRANRLE